MDIFKNLGEPVVVAIFTHFESPYSKDQERKIEMPLVGSCKRVLTIWMKRRHQLAVQELSSLQKWLYSKELKALKAGDGRGWLIDVREISAPLCDIIDVVR